MHNSQFVHHINIIDKDILVSSRFSEDPMLARDLFSNVIILGKRLCILSKKTSFKNG